MLTLHFAPNTCALASLIALEESGLAFEVRKVDFASAEQRSPAYLAINPKGRVPALATDRGVLTETPAILAYVAQIAPEKRLAPLDDLVDELVIRAAVGVARREAAALGEQAVDLDVVDALEPVLPVARIGGPAPDDLDRPLYDDLAFANVALAVGASSLALAVVTWIVFQPRTQAARVASGAVTW